MERSGVKERRVEEEWGGGEGRWRGEEERRGGEGKTRGVEESGGGVGRRRGKKGGKDGRKVEVVLEIVTE